MPSTCATATYDVLIRLLQAHLSWLARILLGQEPKQKMVNGSKKKS
jgi:hypothetical protein